MSKGSKRKDVTDLHRIRDPELRALLLLARAQRFRIRRTGTGRLLVTRRGSQPVVVPSVPGDPRAVANSRAALVRQGLDPRSSRK